MYICRRPSPFSRWSQTKELNVALNRSHKCGESFFLIINHTYYDNIYTFIVQTTRYHIARVRIIYKEYKYTTYRHLSSSYISHTFMQIIQFNWIGLKSNKTNILFNYGFSVSDSKDSISKYSWSRDVARGISKVNNYMAIWKCGRPAGC